MEKSDENLLRSFNMNVTCKHGQVISTQYQLTVHELAKQWHYHWLLATCILLLNVHVIGHCIVYDIYACTYRKVVGNVPGAMPHDHVCVLLQIAVGLL